MKRKTFFLLTIIMGLVLTLFSDCEKDSDTGTRTTICNCPGVKVTTTDPNSTRGKCDAVKKNPASLGTGCSSNCTTTFVED